MIHPATVALRCPDSAPPPSIQRHLHRYPAYGEQAQVERLTGRGVDACGEDDAVADERFNQRAVEEEVQAKVNDRRVADDARSWPGWTVPGDRRRCVPRNCPSISVGQTRKVSSLVIRPCYHSAHNYTGRPPKP